MAVLSNRDLENATQQIVKENSFKKEVKQVIQKEIESIHQQFLNNIVCKNYFHFVFL